MVPKYSPSYCGIQKINTPNKYSLLLLNYIFVYLCEPIKGLEREKFLNVLLVL